jgi:uncharacterized membrane protein
MKDAPWIRWMPLIGVIWLAFAVVIYWFAGLAPIVNNLTGSQTPLQYLNSSGVSFVIIVFVIGAVIYAIQAMRNRRAGIETQLMYQALPPD